MKLWGNDAITSQQVAITPPKRHFYARKRYYNGRNTWLKAITDGKTSINIDPIMAENGAVTLVDDDITLKNEAI